ncbi:MULTISPECIES: xanthine dehydrogenase small subunit [Undibacterium]|uniref:Xanthine dehydrogenase small subunit n=1 Tax=Undibacterium aquatile TaxID=1537398 RepID=A0ABR6XAT0_9BURK|nr:MULTISPECIES: xanthine dehydrogenase small subunit [Undibacterium]MBC3809972.1 xanthine dehydrogenase small subunit [Undibacterium aquatile]MBC3877511.1 xanthine dehydrogenase small subunit [Undibacterium sp. FT79W]
MSGLIRYFFQGQIHEADHLPPTRTLLQHLREDLHCTGTKEGCAEGDCGACTVVTGELRDGKVEMKSVNACLQLMPTLDGKAIFTVEDLSQEAPLHPVQQAMVECHASQCGFCTPGFVMSLWDLYLQRSPESAPLQRKQIDIALSGNLCRCTGYRPIIDAAHRMEELPRQDFDQAGLAAILAGLVRSETLEYVWQGQHFYAPRTMAELVRLRAAHPQACLLAGGTDIGLWVTKQFRELGDIIYLGHVEELRSVTEKNDVLEIGAAVTLDEAYRALCEYYPQELSELWQRFASLPIRHAGTLGGNVANGSPIGDSMPWLIALGSRIVLKSADGERELALEDFYLGYQQKDLRPTEIVAAIRIPLPGAGKIFRTYKLAKRFDQDISAVCAAFSAQLQNGILSEVRIAFGGMAATPKRATHAETALEQQVWNEATLQTAMLALAEDYAPLSDMRASAEYRLQTAQNLLRRFWLETRADDALPTALLNPFAAAADTSSAEESV